MKMKDSIKLPGVEVLTDKQVLKDCKPGGDVCYSGCASFGNITCTEESRENSFDYNDCMEPILEACWDLCL